MSEFHLTKIFHIILLRQRQHLIVIPAFIKEIRITVLEIRCTWGKSVKILDNLKNCAKTGSVNLSFQKGTCLLISLLPLLVIKSPPFFIPFSLTLIIDQYSRTNDIPQQPELKGCNLLVTLCFASTRFCKFRGKNGMDTRKKKILTSLWFTSPAAMLYTKISPDDVPRAMESTTESVVFFAVFCFFLL